MNSDTSSWRTWRRDTAENPCRSLALWFARLLMYSLIKALRVTFQRRY